MKSSWITSVNADLLALLNTFGGKNSGLQEAIVQQLISTELEQKQIELHLKREDLLYPELSGNKYRKLKYNILKAKEEGCHTLLTFGGAFSNHIHATAMAGRDYGFKTIGIIRGEELVKERDLNPTLKVASEAGMQFKFVSRTAYRNKHTPDFLKLLQQEFGSFYTLPEGGTNLLAIKGCEEILTPEDSKYDYICCSVGTGGTIAGLINSSKVHQKIYGFPALKGNFLKKDICKFTSRKNWDLLLSYHFGGYAKVTPSLISFMNDFKEKHGVLLDPVYTAKMLYGLFDLIRKNHFAPNTKILAIHTGGLQGIEGMNRKLKMKNLPLIEV